jgi:outer membrane protein assembly factor BamD
MACLLTKQGFAFWVWTPETNKWVNPKYAVKETPAEQLQYALALYEAKEYNDARRELGKLINHYPRAREAADAQYYVGRSWEDQGKLREAFENYQMVIDKYPFSERSAEIVERQYHIGLKLLEGEGRRSEFSQAFSGVNDDIVNIFEAIIKNAPYGNLAAPSRYKIGLYSLENNMFKEARDEFEKVINDYPDSEWAKAAKYQIAVSDAQRSSGAPYDQRVTQTAVEEFRKFVEHYPEAELSDAAKKQIQELRNREAESQFQIARFYEKRKEYGAARIYYQTIAEEFKNSSWAADALRKIRELNRKIQ